MPEEIFIKNRAGERIFSEFRRFPGRPLVIMCHGFPGTNRNTAVAEALAKERVNVLNIKYRGVGESDGKFTFEGAIEDVFTVLEYSKQMDINHGKVGLFGYSSGALYSIYVAANSRDVGLVALLSPFVIPENYWENYRTFDGLDTEQFLAESVKTARGNPEEWRRGLKVLEEKYSPAQWAPKLKCPVLSVHAENDVEIPASHTLALGRLNRKVECRVIKGTGHYFESKLEEMTGEICGFVAKQWGP